MNDKAKIQFALAAIGILGAAGLYYNAVSDDQPITGHFYRAGYQREIPWPTAPVFNSWANCLAFANKNQLVPGIDRGLCLNQEYGTSRQLVPVQGPNGVTGFVFAK